MNNSLCLTKLPSWLTGTVNCNLPPPNFLWLAPEIHKASLSACSTYRSLHLQVKHPVVCAVLPWQEGPASSCWFITQCMCPDLPTKYPWTDGHSMGTVRPQPLRTDYAGNTWKGSTASGGGWGGRTDEPALIGRPGLLSSQKEPVCLRSTPHSKLCADLQVSCWTVDSDSAGLG